MTIQCPNSGELRITVDFQRASGVQDKRALDQLAIRGSDVMRTARRRSSSKDQGALPPKDWLRMVTRPGAGSPCGPGPCLRYPLATAYGRSGQMNVLQFAKNVRELSPMNSVADQTVPSGVATEAE